MTMTDKEKQRRKFLAFSRAQRIANERGLYRLAEEINTHIDDCYGPIYNSPMSDELREFLKDI